MLEDSPYLEDIDAGRLRRAKELSEIKSQLAVGESSPYGIQSKAVIVLTYAHWEGFYNECARAYIERLKSDKKKVGDVSWSLLAGVLRPELQRLRDRNNSSDAELEFVDRLRDVLACDFARFDVAVVSSRSNLDFDKLRHNFRVLGFDIERFQKWRLRIDKELVGWRHSVAHGDNPDLSSLDMDKHVAFTQELLLALADVFQEAVEQLHVAEGS
ncbi:hypothetical protein KBTX_02919 [wastewater metagenome]|uniref:RiboL-PSP-HEPN domain-containing protein n=2 Tax=unclassified sequences TaxID=12908 RepID=A0A5B8RBT9_9ZZZZ|nr:MAE_28990/MAE_18760 family HEPN-like nuclease [Arhodomonas sp. KWT]QEA06579.1 hypothetical protein KBTEX_02919 [uncultured organism]